MFHFFRSCKKIRRRTCRSRNYGNKLSLLLSVFYHYYLKKIPSSSSIFQEKKKWTFITTSQNVWNFFFHVYRIVSCPKFKWLLFLVPNSPSPVIKWPNAHTNPQVGNRHFLLEYVRNGQTAAFDGVWRHDVVKTFCYYCKQFARFI